MSEFNLRIVTPHKLFFDGQVQGIIVRSTEGELMILSNHTNFVTNLVVSQAKIKIGEEYSRITLAGGLMKVSKSQVTIITHAAEFADHIDVERAEKARHELEERLKNSKNAVETELLEHKLKKAQNRIDAGN